MIDFFLKYPQLVFSSLSAISAFYLFILLTFQYKRRGGINFAILSFTMVVWQGGKVIKNLTLVPDFPIYINTVFWSNLSFAGITFCYCTFFRLACQISFRDKGIFNWLSYLGYLSAFILIYLEIKGVLSNGDIATAYGYFRDPSKWYFLYVLTFGLFMGLGIFVLIPKFYAKVPHLKKQVNTIFFGALCGFSLGSLEFVSIYGYPVYPIADLSPLVFGSIFYWAIYRFNFIAASDIVKSTILWTLYLGTVITVSFFIYHATMFVIQVLDISPSSSTLITLFSFFVFILTPVYLFVLRKTRKRFFPVRYYFRDFYTTLSSQLSQLDSEEKMVQTVIQEMEKEFDYENGTGILFERVDDQFLRRHYKVIGAPLPENLKRNLFANANLESMLSRRNVINELRLDNNPEPKFKILMGLRLLDRLKRDLIIPVKARNEVAALLIFSQSRFRPESWTIVMPILTSISDILGNHLHQIKLLKEQSEKEHLSQVGMMAATMAHEIKNPLGGIYGAAQVLKEGIPNSDRFIEIILKDATRLNHVVRRFLDFSSPFQSSLKAFDLISWLEKFVERQNHLNEEKPLQLNCKIKQLEILSDENGLEQIMLNLTQNAQRFQKSKNPVQIHLYSAGSKIKIAVEDDGIGIPEEDRNKIFTPFYTTSTTGTGLGLSISRKIAKALKGDLYFEPLEPGTRFILELPKGS